MIPKVLWTSDWMWCNMNSGCHCNSGQKKQNWLFFGTDYFIACKNDIPGPTKYELWYDGHFHWLFAKIGCVRNISLRCNHVAHGLLYFAYRTFLCEDISFYMYYIHQ